jgi:hypothetical protein
MATVPTPYHAVAGTKLSASGFNGGVEDVLDWLLDGYPRVHAYDATGNACLDTTSKLILWDSEGYDNDNMHSTSSNTSRITFTTAGLYDVDIQMMFASAAYTGNTAMDVRMNAGGASGGGTRLINRFFNDTGTATAVPALRLIRAFSAGDYIEVFVLQTSGATRTNTTGAHTSRVHAHWIAIN